MLNEHNEIFHFLKREILSAIEEKKNLGLVYCCRKFILYNNLIMLLLGPDAH